jgi:hypothetical protein
MLPSTRKETLTTDARREIERDVNRVVEAGGVRERGLRRRRLRMALLGRCEYFDRARDRHRLNALVPRRRYRTEPPFTAHAASRSGGRT